jgi:hypothetical protein
MGRLGRVRDGDMVGEEIYEGLDDATVAIARSVLSQDIRSLEAIRAAMRSAFKNEGGPDA